MLELINFIKAEPILVVFTIAGCLVVLYASYAFSLKEQLGSSILLALVAALIGFLFSYAYKGHLKEATIKTVIVMPNNKSLRLSEDGKISFCVNGLAREWVSNENGVVSAKAKFYLGRPMKCLSLEEGFAWLRHNGATEEQMEAMQNAYK